MKKGILRYVVVVCLVISFIIPSTAGAYTQADIDSMFSAVQSLLLQVAQLIANRNNLAEVSTGACSISFAAEKPTIASGSATIIYWDATSACSGGKLKGGRFGTEGISVSNEGEKSTEILKQSTIYTLSFGSTSKTLTVAISGDEGSKTPTLTLSANPTSVTAGNSSTLSWTGTNVTSCTASNGWTGTKAVSGSQVIYVEKTTTYTLTCVGSGGSVSQSVTVTANSPTLTPTLTFSANPISTIQDQPVVLSWSTTNATSCTASDSWTGAKAVLGTQTIYPDTTSTYVLSCVGASGNVSKSVTVTVTSGQTPTLTLSANPTSVTAGNSSTLSWTGTNVTSCTASNGWTGTKAIQGTQTVSPTATSTYTLTCTGTGGSVTKSVTVGVGSVPPPPPPPPTGSNITPQNLLAGLGVLTGRPTTQIPAMLTFDNRFNLYEKKHFDQYLIDYQTNNQVASAFNHYGFLRGRLGYAIRNGEPYGAGVTDENQYKYARGRRVVLDYLQKYAKPNNYGVATWLDTGLDDIELLYKLEGTPEALQHIHVRATGATNDPYGYMKLTAKDTDARTVSLGLQSMMSAHRLNVPFSKPTFINYQGGFDSSQGSWASTVKRNIGWLTQYGGVKSDGSIPSPAHGGPEAFFMNAMLANQLLSYYSHIERDSNVFNLAKLIIDHWIDFLPAGWQTLPYLSTDKAQAPDLAMFYVYPSLVMWQETQNQKYYTFAMNNLAAANASAYIQGMKQWNQVYSTGGENIEALISGVHWKQASPAFPIGVNPPPPPTAPTLTLSANPTSVTAGNSSTLSWTGTNVTSCTASNGWTGTKAIQGTQTVSPTATSTYTLTCTGTGGSVTKSVTVGVGSVTPPPPGQKFVIGDSVQTTANLNVRSTAAGTILGQQPLGSTGKVIGGPVTLQSPNEVNNWWNVDYTNAPDGWSFEGYLTKTALPPPPATTTPTLTLSANPTSVTAGNSSTLSWTGTNVTSCTASNGWTGTKAIQGTQTVSPTATSTYTLTCTGTGGSVTKSVTVGVGSVTPPPPIGIPQLPILPQVYVDTTMPTQTGKTITVNAGGNFQQALNQAVPGDTIVLEAGATFTGNFTLPNKNSTGQWIVITSSKASSLPPPGKRVFPKDAVNMPKIVSKNPSRAIVANQGAGYYRFIGVEITDDGIASQYGPTLPSGGKGGYSYGLIDLGTLGRDTQVSHQPHHIIFDRSYIHGQPNSHIKFGVSLNGTHLAVIDSYLSEFHGIGQDTQAINGYNGSGPFKIVNNHLEGAGENIIFGGADPSIPGVITRDVEIRGNYFYKPTSWMMNDPANPFKPNPNYVGIRWLVKNSFELKQGERFLVEGNIFKHNWADGQTGFPILIKMSNQGGGQAGAHLTTRDITFRYNIIDGAPQGANLAGVSAPPGVKTDRYLLEHNVWLDIDARKWTNYSSAGCCAGLAQILSVADNTVFRNNTGLQNNGNFLSTGGNASLGVFVNDNIANYGPYGISGTVSTSLPNAVISNNVIVGKPLGSTYPGNFNSPTVAGVGFVGGSNPVTAADFALAPTSPFKGKASNGGDPGADISKVLTATQYAVSGAGQPPVVSSMTSSNLASINQTSSVLGATVSGFYRTLSKGMNGSDVSLLQNILRSLGFFSEETTGYFGSLTEEAVKRFQAEQNIVSGGDSQSTGYGLVGPRTQQRLVDLGD